MAAGLATLEGLTPEIFDKLDRLTQRLIAGLEDVFSSTRTVATIVASGSTFSIYFTSGPVRNYRDVAAADKKSLSGVFISLLNLSLIHI